MPVSTAQLLLLLFANVDGSNVRGTSGKKPRESEGLAKVCVRNEYTYTWFKSLILPNGPTSSFFQTKVDIFRENCLSLCSEFESDSSGLFSTRSADFDRHTRARNINRNALISFPGSSRIIFCPRDEHIAQRYDDLCALLFWNFDPKFRFKNRGDINFCAARRVDNNGRSGNGRVCFELYLFICCFFFRLPDYYPRRRISRNGITFCIEFCETENTRESLVKLRHIFLDPLPQTTTVIPRPHQPSALDNFRRRHASPGTPRPDTVSSAPPAIRKYWIRTGRWIHMSWKLKILPHATQQYTLRNIINTPVSNKFGWIKVSHKNRPHTRQNLHAWGWNFRDFFNNGSIKNSNFDSGNGSGSLNKNVGPGFGLYRFQKVPLSFVKDKNVKSKAIQFKQFLNALICLTQQIWLVKKYKISLN